MTSLISFKKSLGSAANNLTEVQIVKLKESQENLADILFNMWLKDKCKNDKIKDNE